MSAPPIDDPRVKALIEEHRQFNVDHDWWEFIYDDFVMQMEAIGVNVTCDKHGAPLIHFSGFWSQGDGACFEGGVQDWSKFLPALDVKHNEALVDVANHDLPWMLRWDHSGRYCHSNSVDFSWDMDIEEEFINGDDFVRAAKIAAIRSCDTPETIRETAKTFLRGKMDELYHSLEEEYEYLTSDETVYESLVANEMLDELEDEEADETT